MINYILYQTMCRKKTQSQLLIWKTEILIIIRGDNLVIFVNFKNHFGGTKNIYLV